MELLAVREILVEANRRIAVITVAPAVKYSFVSKGMQTRRTGQHKAKLTLSPRLHVKPLITVITAIAAAPFR